MEAPHGENDGVTTDPRADTETLDLRRELERAAEREAAIRDVVQTIARATFDLDAVLQTVIDRAVELCHADNGNIARHDGDVYRVVAFTNYGGEYERVVRERVYVPERGSLIGRTLLDDEEPAVAGGRGHVDRAIQVGGDADGREGGRRLGSGTETEGESKGQKQRVPDESGHCPPHPDPGVLRPSSGLLPPPIGRGNGRARAGVFGAGRVEASRTLPGGLGS